MTSNVSEKVIAKATIAVALVAAIQGMVAFNDFSKDAVNNPLAVGALIILGIFAIFACVLAADGIWSIFLKNK